MWNWFPPMGRLHCTHKKQSGCHVFCIAFTHSCTHKKKNFISTVWITDTVWRLWSHHLHNGDQQLQNKNAQYLCINLQHNCSKQYWIATFSPNTELKQQSWCKCANLITAENNCNFLSHHRTQTAKLMQIRELNYCSKQYSIFSSNTELKQQSWCNECANLLPRWRHCISCSEVPSTSRSHAHSTDVLPPPQSRCRSAWCRTAGWRTQSDQGTSSCQEQSQRDLWKQETRIGLKCTSNAFFFVFCTMNKSGSNPVCQQLWHLWALHMSSCQWHI
jgi:hypothetical protein